MSVKMNVDETFLKLLQLHFPKRHPMYKVFNRKTVIMSKNSCIQQLLLYEISNIKCIGSALNFQSIFLL